MSSPFTETPTPTMKPADPYTPHLRQADDLFDRGDFVKAGQIWQAILKQNPAHAEARANLLAVKQQLLALRAAEAAAVAALPAPEVAPPAPIAAPEPEPPLPPVFDPQCTAPEAPLPVDPGKVITGTLDPERLLRQGCTLYDMGQLEDALKKWEQVLALDPEHALARSYATGARRELGLPSLQTHTAPAPVQTEVNHADEDLEKLLREAVQLYDMGLVGEAISKWERILILEPQRQEVEGYLRQARAEAASAPSQAPVPAPSPAPDSEALDLKLRQGEHLLNLQRRDEAAFTFQQALALAPGNARALLGLDRCRRLGDSPDSETSSRSIPAPVLDLDPQSRIGMAGEEGLRATEPQAIEPPATLLKAAPAPREGLSLPDRIRQATEAMPWLKEPKLLAGVGGGIFVVVVALVFIQGYRKDVALKDEVRAAKAAAVAPVAQAPELAESPADIRQEAETALGTDPLRAYLRAETLLSRNPGEAAGPQLLEKARTGLQGGVTGASLPEFQKHLQNGDLEAALKVIDALLRAQPGDGELRARAARLNLTLCFAHASQAKWDEAKEDLLRGRALFPDDKTWQARLKLLDRVKAMPKEQRPAWITVLG